MERKLAGLKSCSSLLGLGLALVLTMVVAVSSFAQSTSNIVGTVKDTTGAVIPGATVTVQNTETGLMRTVTSGSDGAFRVPAMPVGHYTVKFEKTGFKTETDQGLVLDVGQDLTVNASLSVGTSTQEVVVTGEAALVNTQETALGGLVNEQSIADLPLNGRNYIDLSLLQPGVTQKQNSSGAAGTGGTWFSSQGAPAYSNIYTLDGAILNNQYWGNSASLAGNTLGVDGIREYKVLTNAYDASYGMSMGGQMVIASKGGSNSFHGDAFDYLRNSVLDARNYFDGPPSLIGHRLPEFRRNNFGGSIGGPIRKDKTFFFAVYEGLRQNVGFTAADSVLPAACHVFNNPNTNNTTLANPTGCSNSGLTSTTNIPAVVQPLIALYPTPNLPGNLWTFPTSSLQNEDYGQVRIDHNIGASDTLFGRYTIDKGNVDNANTSTLTIDQGVAFPTNRVLGTSIGQFLTVSENHIFSPSLLNTVRLSFSRSNFPSDNAWINNLPGIGNLGAPQYSFLGNNIPLGVIIVTGISNNGPNATFGPPNLHLENIYTLSDDVYYTRGKHALKFGALINRFNQAADSVLQSQGQLQFGSIANFMKGIPATYTAQTPGSDTNRDWIYNTFGFYAQDDYRVSSKLTFNLGLRYEFMTSLHELNNQGYTLGNYLTGSTFIQGPVLDNPTYKNVSPRIGVAFDPTGSGKTAIRASYGIYYDVGNLGAVLSQQAFGAPPNTTTSQVNNSTANAVLTLPLTFPASAKGLALHTSNYYWKQPYTQQYSLSVEHQLPGDASLTVSYVGLRGIHLWTEVEGNPTIPTADVNGVEYWSTATPGCGSTPNASGLFCRQNPHFGSNTFDNTVGDSWFNALEVVVHKRLGHGLEFQNSYTYAKLLDTTEGQLYAADCNGATGMFTGLSPDNLKLDKGPACQDIRHNDRINLVYHLPSVRSDNKVLSKLGSGWWTSSIVSLQGGYPFTPQVGVDRAEGGVIASQVPDRVNVNTAASIAATPCTSLPGQTAAGSNPCAYTPVPFNKNTVYTGNPNQWFNPAMFSMTPMVPCPTKPTATCGVIGNAGRGLLRGPGLTQWNFSLVKDTAVGWLGEAGSVQFRAEVFNITNSPNFAMPNGTVFAGTVAPASYGPYSLAPNGTSGQVTGTAVGDTSRQIQLALKLIF
ncbi:MAG TPA: TonB-dependent receptor [Candidatus Acidoferrales bacterium]|jgi:hypothetical protein|nr:TonB-dependent receptor [Candidatus Acidoferrales bacterium]